MTNHEEERHMPEITVKTKVPLTSGKEATFTLEDGEVAMSLPVSWRTPTFTLTDLRVALEELEAGQAAGAVTAEQHEDR